MSPFLRRVHAVVPFALVALGAASAASQSAARRLAIEDYYRVKTVGNPELSPDGKWVAFTVATRVEATNDNASEVWLVPADGSAFDPSSTTGAGIDQVEFFLDSREAGGVSLGGTTVPGAANPALPRVYNSVVHIPTAANGLHNFVTYARSSLTGLETNVSVPVFIGEPPSPTPRP